MTVAPTPRPPGRLLPSGATLRWVLRNRAWTPYHLLRYLRLAWLRVRHPDVVVQGPVFLGKGVRIEVRPGYGRLVLGRFVHVGDACELRAHEGTLRIGDKAVLGSRVTVNCYLDVEIGGSTLVADEAYITDFDHVADDVHVPIKDQGIVKSPVRIGPDCWLGHRATILRGVEVGRGSVVAASAVVTRDVPAYSVAAGIPARVVKDRQAAYDAAAAHRAALADMARKQGAPRVG